jgi:hypothetical protein
MRQLTSRQKKMLDLYVSEFKDRNGRFPFSADELPGYQLDNVDKVNPCELFWQNVNRYLVDKFFAAQRAS